LYESTEQRRILGSLLRRGEAMYDSNGHVRTTEMVAEIGDERVVLLARGARTPAWPCEVGRQPGRDGDGTKYREWRR
jgi:hypothetical protein